MRRPVLDRLLDPTPLGPADVRSTFETLVEPTTAELTRAAILVAIAGRRLTAAELADFARAMRRRARPFSLPAADRAIDLCGSGGARTPSFNVSTVSAFVVAAAGVPVVKHGNRSASGLCGSSDLLEALGLPVTRAPGFARATYRARRIAFLHAPLYHPATKAVGPARRALGIPTIFNRLGPLCNPAPVRYQVSGATTPARARDCADVLGRLGIERALAMSSEDGCDEFSPKSRTRTFESRGRRLRVGRTDPAALLTRSERRGGWGALPPVAAAREAERLLQGADGARRGAVVLTSAAALRLAGRVVSLAEGTALARATLDSGDPAALLEDLRGVASSSSPERDT